MNAGQGEKSEQEERADAWGRREEIEVENSEGVFTGVEVLCVQTSDSLKALAFDSRMRDGERRKKVNLFLTMKIK